MSYELHCADVVEGCAFSVHSNQEEEVIRVAREHLKSQHAMVVDHDDAKAAVTNV
jgi:predicted small metal-binding protein